MGELNAFSFRPGRSGLHRLDARIKLLGLVLVSLLSMGAGYLPLAMLSILLMALLRA